MITTNEDLQEIEDLGYVISDLQTAVKDKKKELALKWAADAGFHIGDIVTNKFRDKVIVDILFDLKKQRRFAIVASRLKADGKTPYQGREILKGAIHTCN